MSPPYVDAGHLLPPSGRRLEIRATLSERGETLPMFGVPARRVLPHPHDSCDALGVVDAYDGHRYVVKTGDYWVATPLNEQFCHELCSACGIEMPPWREIIMPDGTSAFGSRVLPDKYEHGTVLNTPVQLVQRLENPEATCKVIIVDIFVYNEDRHWNNFVFVPGESKDKVRAYPIDFSRALLHYAFPPREVDRMPRDCHTLTTARILSNVNWRPYGAIWVAA
jgi:hypothetical protein